jgi:hypothetical protein
MKILKLLGTALSKINMLYVHGTVADPDPHGPACWEAGSGFRICSRVKSWIRIRIRIEIKIQELYRLKTDRSIEGRGRSQWICGRSVLCKPVVTASHYFDKEQDSDPDPGPQKLKRRQICIKVMRIRKPGAR